jgi:hypothetical protein
MPSVAYRRWRTVRALALDEIEQAHTAVGGTGPGRRYATLQVNQAYAVLLASQFQGFCRDLHSECVDHLVVILAPPPTLEPLVRDEFLRGRQLDQRNAQPASIGADFVRLGLDFWADVAAYRPGSTARKAALDQLNAWRNAIAHQSFDPSKLGGTTTLRLIQVKRWRGACLYLARCFDEVMRQHLQHLTAVQPW